MDNNEIEFSRIVRENKSTIYTVCYMFSNDEDEVNDLFQEILINMWRGFSSFQDRSKINTWIYRVAMNTCISADRKKKRRFDIPTSHRKDSLPLSMDINLYEDNDADTLQIQQLHSRINKLGLVDRAIILMWLEDMSYDEIAAVVGITPQNVGVKLFRIKEQLKKG